MGNTKFPKFWELWAGPCRLGWGVTDPPTKAVVKVRGLGGLRPLLRFEPPAIV